MFGEVGTGNYTLTAEKEGFMGSIDFYVSSDTGRKFGQAPLRFSETSVNLTLKGYRVPVFNSSQLSYGGAITGTIYDKSHNRRGANVSLWQNGQMVKMPKNPQRSASNATYLFEHVAPGLYAVRAEAGDASGNTHNNSTSVVVANGTVTADVIIASMYGSVHIATPVPTPDTSSATTSVLSQSTLLNTSANTPAPFPGIGLILITMGIAVALVYGFRRQS